MGGGEPLDSWQGPATGWSLHEFLANKKRKLRYTPPMAAARCKVSYSDSEGFVHVAYVEAESLYEAVALAVQAVNQ